ncbi:type II toxin-antitoxin system VapC family toxin [Methylocystis heyeri]|uniref:PIN domain-containing protein n=1 Tax=Methylocystis heyeri TaxID=391905 RepID=A0A6B8KGK6_9HYPH|nr:PIN domain-containing protein [Methylocystis heyeri]QGM45688.1 PIN domain-containing protein [Methylocystis heyeri]
MTDFSAHSVSRAYFDTNAIIYFVEGHPEFQTKVADLWYALIERNACLVTSEIGVAECLFGAFRQGSRELEQGYERLFFQEDAFDIQPVNLEALIEAGRLGASQGMRLIDAIHFHAAATTKCEIFVTNDRRIRSNHGVRVIYISEL